MRKEIAFIFLSACGQHIQTAEVVDRFGSIKEAINLAFNKELISNTSNYKVPVMVGDLPKAYDGETFVNSNGTHIVISNLITGNLMCGGDCLNETMMHEIGHALGLKHTHPSGDVMFFQTHYESIEDAANQLAKDCEVQGCVKSINLFVE